MSKSDMRARRDSMDCILWGVNAKGVDGEKRESQSSTFDAASAWSESSIQSAVNNGRATLERRSGFGYFRTTQIFSHESCPDVATNADADADAHAAPTDAADCPPDVPTTATATYRIQRTPKAKARNRRQWQTPPHVKDHREARSPPFRTTDKASPCPSGRRLPRRTRGRCPRLRDRRWPRPRIQERGRAHEQGSERKGRLQPHHSLLSRRGNEDEASRRVSQAGTQRAAEGV